MSWELYYTSVRQGLIPGKRGFCTAAATDARMPLVHLERIESLSVYSPAFPPSDPQADKKNPVSHCHWLISLGGEQKSVLSRICYRGVDYTGRASKLAHHVLVEPREREAAKGGPAWAIYKTRIKEDTWDGKTGESGIRPKLPADDYPAEPAKTWRTMTGDAGWAGVLAGAFLDSPERPSYIVFEPGADVLALVFEALRLIPPARRWQVSFSTYFTGLPQGTPCAWRCCLKDSPELLKARRRPGTLVLNLTNVPLGKVEEKVKELSDGTVALIQAARQGSPVEDPVEHDTAIDLPLLADDVPTPRVGAIEPIPISEMIPDNTHEMEEDMKAGKLARMALIAAVVMPILLSGALVATIFLKPEWLHLYTKTPVTQNDSPPTEQTAPVKTTQDIESLKEEISSTNGTLNDQKKRIDDLKDELAESQKANTDLKTQFEKMESAIELLTTQLKSNDESNKQLSKQIEDTREIVDKAYFGPQPENEGFLDISGADGEFTHETVSISLPEEIKRTAQAIHCDQYKDGREVTVEKGNENGTDPNAKMSLTFTLSDGSIVFKVNQTGGKTIKDIGFDRLDVLDINKKKIFTVFLPKYETISANNLNYTSSIDVAATSWVVSGAAANLEIQEEANEKLISIKNQPKAAVLTYSYIWRTLTIFFLDEQQVRNIGKLKMTFKDRDKKTIRVVIWEAE